jgi:hypothetical protein
MHQQIQLNVQNLPIPAITMQVPLDMALQNGQLGDRQQWRATRILPPDSKLQNKDNMSPLVQK